MGTLEDAMKQFLAANPSLAVEEAKDEDQVQPAGDDVEKHPRQTLHVLLERKGRGGKVATIVEGFTLDDDEVARVASEIKKKLGVGGSSRGGEILIQGDRVKQVAQLLRSMSFTVKGA